MKLRARPEQPAVRRPPIAMLILPLLWLVYKRSPAWGAWLGAVLTVIGTMLILLD